MHSWTLALLVSTTPRTLSTYLHSKTLENPAHENTWNVFGFYMRSPLFFQESVQFHEIRSSQTEWVVCYCCFPLYSLTNPLFSLTQTLSRRPRSMQQGIAPPTLQKESSTISQKWVNSRRAHPIWPRPGRWPRDHRGGMARRYQIRVLNSVT